MSQAGAHVVSGSYRIAANATGTLTAYVHGLPISITENEIVEVLAW